MGQLRRVHSGATNRAQVGHLSPLPGRKHTGATTQKSITSSTSLAARRAAQAKKSNDAQQDEDTANSPPPPQLAQPTDNPFHGIDSQPNSPDLRRMSNDPLINLAPDEHTKALLRRDRAEVKRFITATFKDIDKDGSGTLSYEEFAKALRRFGVADSKEMLHRVAQLVDTDNSGSIDIHEFSALIAKDAGSVHNLGYFSNEMAGFLNIAAALTRQGAELAMQQKSQDAGLTPLAAKVARAKQAAAQMNSTAKESVSRKRAESMRKMREMQEAEQQEKLAKEQLRAEKRDAELARTVSHALMVLRECIESTGSFGAVIRANENHSIGKSEMSMSLRKLGLNVGDKALDRIMHFLGLDPLSKKDQRHVCTQVLTNLGVDNTGTTNEITNKKTHVVDGEQLPARVTPPAVTRRLRAVFALERMRDALLSRKDKLTSDDVDGEPTTSHSNFCGMVSRHVPDVDAQTLGDICKLSDTKNLGHVNVSEVSEAVTTSDNRMDKLSASAIAVRYEKEALLPRQADATGARRGRFASTPVSAYGLQVRELLKSYPGSTHFATETNRLQREDPAYKGIRTWQVADAQRAKNKRMALEAAIQKHAHEQRERYGNLDDAYWRKEETKLDAKFRQKQRYISSISMDRRVQRQLMG